jgi:hypothetical protein
LTKRVADEFCVAHDRVSTIPFTVRMSQLGTSLSAWADELGLHSRSASRVTFVGETLDSEIHALPNGQKCRLCGQDGHLDQTCHRFANHVIGDKLMRDNAALAKQVVSANSSFITNSARNKAQRTTSTIRQLSAPSIDIGDTVGPVSMMEHPSVAHVTLANESLDDESTETIDRMVDHVQAVHLDPFDVSLGTIYNRSLLDEINANCDPAPMANTASPSGTVPTEPDGVLFYDAQDTVQVKDMPTDW